MKADAVVPLAATFRNETLESLHHGVMVVLDRSGGIQESFGDPTTTVFPRSSLKPLQGYAMVRAGLELPDELMALVCASHDSTRTHEEGVRRILHGVGLDESALANTPDLPLEPGRAEEVLRSGGGRTSLQQNCSGKHAGMLATCRHHGWPSDPSYLTLDHPLQICITEGVQDLAGESIRAIGIDGCGAPTHAVSLLGLARAFRHVAATPDDPAARTVYRAMTSFPEMVGGPTNVTTRLMRSIPGLLAKDGAEGVYALALPDGRAMALKVADGANRARPPLLRSALEMMSVSLNDVDPDIFTSVILGHGQRVGDVRSVATIGGSTEGG
ncbi:MAG: asparaginase [Ilumatobacteraceae bacterium]